MAAVSSQNCGDGRSTKTSASFTDNRSSALTAIFGKGITNTVRSSETPQSATPSKFAAVVTQPLQVPAPSGPQPDKVLTNDCSTVSTMPREKVNLKISVPGEAGVDIPATGLFARLRLRDWLPSEWPTYIPSATSPGNVHMFNGPLRRTSSAQVGKSGKSSHVGKCCKSGSGDLSSATNESHSKGEAKKPS